MKIRPAILLVLGVCLLLHGCKKDCDEDPTVDTSNLSKLLLTIDGETHEDCTPGLIFASIVGIYYTNDDELSVGANYYCFDDPLDNFSVNIFIAEPSSGGTYELGEESTGNYAFLHFPELNQIFSTSGSPPGELSISEFDSESGRLNGTFSFECVNEDTSELIEVTGGVLQNISVNPY